MSADAAGTADVPTSALDAVLLKSVDMPEGTPTVKGYDFEGTLDLQALLDSMLTSGFRGDAVRYAVDEVNKMLKWRLSDEPVPEDANEEERDPRTAPGSRPVFLGFTSNLISSGVREQLKFLMKHKMVDVLVTTAGGGGGSHQGARPDLSRFLPRSATLALQGLNRIGNLLVPNDNYCKFEDWMMPILDAMKREQDEQGVRWTPSRIIKRLGLEINSESSVYYWAAKNNIPVYCPALTDGSIGDMLYFHSFKNPGLIVDLVEDIRAMNDEARLVARPKKTSMIILGGGRRQAPHQQRQPHAKRRGLRRLHQHRAGVRRKRQRRQTGRGDQLGKDSTGGEPGQGVRRTRSSLFRRANLQEELERRA